MSKPRLLDLFCGAGGCAVGYARAGFEVVGVDAVVQRLYPFEFEQGDALAYMDWFCGDHPSPDRDCCSGHRWFDAIHASPPCQAYSHARLLGNRGRSDNPRLIAPVRELLEATGLPYVIENVEDAREHLREPGTICGTSLGLAVKRHRLFETNWPLLAPPCACGRWQTARYQGTPRADGSRPLSRYVNQMASGTTHEALADAMGIDWMPAPGRKRPSAELCEAIPPAYTELVGSQLLTHVEAQAVSA